MKKTIALVLMLLTCATEIFSRAGGGGGGGGHSGGGGGYDYGYDYGYGHHYYYYGHGSGHDSVSSMTINLVIIGTLAFTALFFFSFALLLIHSRKKARKKLERAKQFDHFWNEEKMKMHVREIFPKVQSAWMSRELRDVAELVSPRFIGTFQPMLNGYKRRKILNVVDQVYIEQVNIVDVHDDQDNTKDRFAAYIKGQMRDYLVHESRGIAGTIGHAEIGPFEDVYIFIRKENGWILDHIVNDPETRDFKIKNHYR